VNDLYDGCEYLLSRICSAVHAQSTSDLSNKTNSVSNEVALLRSELSVPTSVLQ